MLDEVIDKFNAAATELQTTEFRNAKTPDEWQRLAKNTGTRDYAKLLSAVCPLTEAYRIAPASDRARVGPKLNSEALGILRKFASSAAVLAVRRESPELIIQGLTALAILGSIDDVRDLTLYLAALHYSAMKLQIDTHKVFADATALVPLTLLQNEMKEFPLRAPKDRDPATFGFREVLTDEGFDLVHNSEWALQNRSLLSRLRQSVTSLCHFTRR